MLVDYRECRYSEACCSHRYEFYKLFFGFCNDRAFRQFCRKAITVYIPFLWLLGLHKDGYRYSIRFKRKGIFWAFAWYVFEVMDILQLTFHNTEVPFAAG